MIGSAHVWLLDNNGRPQHDGSVATDVDKKTKQNQAMS